MSGYKIPAARHRVEEVIERSRFITTIAYAPTPDAARAFIDELRNEFADANHNCWAFIAGPPGSTAAVGFSDAGEPHGTAGRPMLDVLLHSEIGAVASVVTRYFGGTKLGKGGLVRAYGGCVQHALASLPTVLYVERKTLRITAGYSDVELLRKLLAEHNADVIGAVYGESVEYDVAAPLLHVDAIVDAIADVTAGRARITIPAD